MSLMVRGVVLVSLWAHAAAQTFVLSNAGESCTDACARSPGTTACVDESAPSGSVGLANTAYGMIQTGLGLNCVATVQMDAANGLMHATNFDGGNNSVCTRPDTVGAYTCSVSDPDLLMVCACTTPPGPSSPPPPAPLPPVQPPTSCGSYEHMIATRTEVNVANGFCNELPLPHSDALCDQYYRFVNQDGQPKLKPCVYAQRPNSNVMECRAHHEWYQCKPPSAPPLLPPPLPPPSPPPRHQAAAARAKPKLYPLERAQRAGGARGAAALH